jgi:CBS domain-containing protein
MCSEVATVKPETTIAEALDIIFKARYHDAIVVKKGAFMGIIVWHELVKIPPDQKNQLQIEQLPIKKISVFPDESLLEAQKLMLREKITVLPIVDQKDSSKVACVLTQDGIMAAFERAKNFR